MRCSRPELDDDAKQNCLEFRAPPANQPWKWLDDGGTRAPIRLRSAVKRWTAGVFPIALEPATGRSPQ